MVYTKTAGWTITTKGEVLLKRIIDEHTKIICYEPIKGKVSSGEFAPNACHRTIQEILNKVLPAVCQRYLLTRLTKPAKEIREDFTFGGKDEVQGVRWHFFYVITPEWILEFLPSSEFRLLKKEDWESVQKFTEGEGKPLKDSEQTVLYDFDYKILINRIWEIQKVLAPIW